MRGAWWRAALLLTLSAGQLGCSPLRSGQALVAIPQRGASVIDETEFHCARAAMDKDSPYRMPLAGRELDPALAAQLSGIPERARRAALAAGLEPLLSRLLAARAASGPQLTAPALELEEELTLRLLAFHAQLSAAAFEAGCTADMIQKVVADLTRHEQSRQLSIAVASLVVGAIAGIAAGSWSLGSDDPRGPAITGIAGGVVTTALGAAALIHGDHPIVLLHSRNRLTPIERGADPEHLYPSFVFRMLTSREVPGGATPRDALLAAWQGQLDRAMESPRHETARRLLLGDGGVYDDQLLAVRAEMFESLESAVQGIARDLELLNRSLVRSLTTTSPPPAPLPAGSPSPSVETPIRGGGLACRRHVRARPRLWPVKQPELLGEIAARERIR